MMIASAVLMVIAEVAGSLLAPLAKAKIRSSEPMRSKCPNSGTGLT
jgi:hypothetical protein